jgi:hypothetical protein
LAEKKHGGGRSIVYVTEDRNVCERREILQLVWIFPTVDKPAQGKGGFI